VKTPSAIGNYLHNLTRLLSGSRRLRPLVVVYLLTPVCNLHCAYCEDFAQAREPLPPPLPLDDARRVLRMIRNATDRLILTGGEPLLYPDIVPLVQHARQELGFHLTMQSNGALLPQFEAVLPHLERLVVSLDSTDPVVLSRLTGVPSDTAAAIRANIRAYAGRQREFGYRMIVNAVLTPETLPGVERLLAFCTENDLLLSLSPQSSNNWPRYDLLVADAYRTLLNRLPALKRRGAPLLGSAAYLRTLAALVPYSCYPLLVPRILPNGDLLYPCRPIERSGTAQGGRPTNLLAVDSWEEALTLAWAEYGPPPRVCNSCYQQCYIEPSLMQSHPWTLLWEVLRYPASRRGGLATFAPG
jgi:MoaA/NifB/PqqE/SkfB family radical SAM enzyme